MPEEIPDSLDLPKMNRIKMFKFDKNEASMNPADCNWAPIPASEWNLQSWTYGKIKQISDLYSPSIFGATQNLRCECGKLSGPATVGDYCTKCDVFVTDDTEKIHRIRAGRLELAAPIRHPLSSAHWLQEFPIAPIGYRLSIDGKITSLGSKYEKLVQANVAAGGSWKDRFMKEGAGKFEKADSKPLVDSIRDIIGIYDDCNSSPVALGRDDTLLSLILAGLASLQPDVSTLVRCCGIVLKIQVAL